MKTGLWLGSLVVSLGLFGLTGCKTEPFCKPLGTCGGNFIVDSDKDFRKNDGLKDHEWTIHGQIHGELTGSFCQDQLQVPPTPLSLLRQPPVQATDRPPDKVTADWCYNLVLKGSGEVNRFIVWAPPIPLKVGQLVMSEDYDGARDRGTYSMQITYAQTRSLEFSETCLTAQGIRPTCPELGRHLGQFLAAEANIYSVRCYDPGGNQGGCNCLYELTFIGGPNGRWFAGDVPGQVTFQVVPHDAPHAAVLQRRHPEHQHGRDGRRLRRSLRGGLRDVHGRQARRQRRGRRLRRRLPGCPLRSRHVHPGDRAQGSVRRR
jgi:hypothetical protein